MSKAEYDLLAEKIIGAAISVHRELGPGLLESAYEACLEHELISSGFRLVRQLALPVVYRTMKIEAGYRIDLLVEDAIIVELKAVDRLEKIHEAQLITYLKLSEKKLGLLMNFNSTKLSDGVRRFIQGNFDT